MLLLVAGTHGMEYVPILALQRLRTTIDPRTLRGTVLMVHTANMPSFLGRTIYYSPVDGKNLNRVFPGKADGTLSERIADVLTREMIGRATHVVDLHCGDGNEALRARYDYDPARAKKLLAEAGHATGLSLKLWRSQRAELARIAQAVQQDLAQVGVTVEIIQRDASSARAAVRKGEADLFLTDWYADYPDPENFTYPLFHSRNAGTGGNYAFLDDPVVDSLTVALRTTVDSARKERLAREADARIHALAPWIFLWHPVDLWARNPDADGWEIPAIFNGQRWLTARYIPR